MTATHEWPEVYPRDERDAAENRKLIPRDAAQYPWIFKCGHPDCHWTTAHKTQEGAHRERTRHQAESCPLTGNVRGGTGSMASITTKIWEHLDAATVVVMEGKPADNADPSDWEKFYKAQGNARGLSMAIFELTTPEFEDSTAVVKHAVKRYKAAKAGEELPPTPGINTGTNSPHLNRERDSQTRKTAQAAARKAPADAVSTGPTAGQTSTATIPPAASVKQQMVNTGMIPPDKRALVENGLAAGFPKEKLVMLTKLTMDQVLAIEAEGKAAANG